ncbi:hypothetical protein [Luedemannella helvata]|uniref:ATP-binding protein n=1 Tax=Luedemannella helvata TaxID=349315 RepID=A0ABP4WB59_9ACTN
MARKYPDRFAPADEPDDVGFTTATAARDGGEDLFEDLEDELEDLDGHRISTWGGSGAGKSTFLAALSRAALTATGDSSGWTVAPVDEPSATYLATAAASLQQRAFPMPSQRREIYRFALLRRAQADGTGVVRAELRVTDGSGDDTAMSDMALAGDVDEMLASDGFLFLFDPTLPAKGKSNSETLDPLVVFLKQRAEETQTWVDARLPHYVAVCVTKFDNEEVFRRSLRGGWVNQDPDTRMPCVRPVDAAKYVAWMCAELGETSVHETIQGDFHPDRIRFFVSSAIGFHQTPRQGFDSHAGNPFNYDRQPGRAPRIRGAIHPINVLEPVVWLQDRLRQHGERF